MGWDGIEYAIVGSIVLGVLLLSVLVIGIARGCGDAGAGSSARSSACRRRWNT